MASQSKTILVVDDEPDLRDILKKELELDGCSVLEAKNGTEALELVKSRQVGAIISDIRMPGGDGLTLLNEVKKHNAALPIILVSGYSDINYARALKLGAAGLYAKPFDLKEVCAHALKLCSQSHT